jgi:phosphoribulokinase
MSRKHPIVAVTGSSGAGTTMVQRAFADIFRRSEIRAAEVHGDAFFRYNRTDMAQTLADSLTTGLPLSHFGPEVNLFDDLEALFDEYSRTGSGRIRRYAKGEEEAQHYGVPCGEFTPWETLEKDTDLLFYEGLHGGVASHTWTRRRSSPAHRADAIAERRGNGKQVDVARHVDLLIGVVPVINLEWIQKIHRDCGSGGCSQEAVVDTILRRMNDYIHFIVPQFSITDINFQRVPVVDTSNPFIARDVPNADESVVVVHFRDPRRFDFREILREIEGAWMSRPNTMVVPGGKMDVALEVVCTPIIQRLVEQRRGA